MSQSDVKFGISGLGEDLKCASIDGLNYFYIENVDYPKKKISALLPAYDEYMVGYSEGRNIAFPPDIDKSFLGNGIFKPIVLSNNAIVGTWKKISKKEHPVEIQFLSDRKLSKINSKLKALELFLRNHEK